MHCHRYMRASNQLGPVAPSSMLEAIRRAYLYNRELRELLQAARGYTGKVSCSYDEVLAARLKKASTAFSSVYLQVERCISELQDLVKASPRDISLSP